MLLVVFPRGQKAPKGLRTCGLIDTLTPAAVAVPAVLPSLRTHCHAPGKCPVFPEAQLVQT